MQGRDHEKGRRKHAFQHLKDAFDPRDLLTFVELDEFIDDWNSLDLNVEEDLFALQIAIMTRPEAAPVIEGTGGLRKLRFAPTRWRKGKRESVRACYVYFKEHALVLLVAAYDHREKDHLSARDKAGIKQYIVGIEKYLNERSSQ